MRRATDVMLIVPAFLALVALIVAQPSSGIEDAIRELIANLPGWLDGLWGLTYDLLALLAVGLLVAALVTRRTWLAFQALLAVVLAVAIALLASRIGLGRWPDLPDYVTGDPATSRFPAVRVGWTSAVVATLLPDLARPVRRAARWVLLVGALGAMLLAAATPSGVAAGLLIALIAAAGVRLVFVDVLPAAGVGLARDAVAPAAPVPRAPVARHRDRPRRVTVTATLRPATQNFSNLGAPTRRVPTWTSPTIRS